MSAKNIIIHGMPYSTTLTTVSPPSGIANLSRYNNTLNGTFGAGAAAPAWRRLASGRQVLYYDGGDYVDFGAIADGSPLILGTQPCTVIMTLNIDSLAAGRFALSNWSNVDRTGEIAIRYAAAIGLRFSRKTAVNQETYITSGNIVAGQYYRVAGTWDGTTYSIYLNGQLANSGAGANAALVGGNTNLYVGTFEFGGFTSLWLGYIDPEFIIANRSYSAGEIAADYEENKGWYGLS